MIIKVPEIWDYEKHGPGNVVEWFKKPGEAVARNDLLCQIMVVKATHNIFSDKAGTLTRIIADSGTEVKPGDELGELSEMVKDEKESTEPTEAKSQETTERIRATPSARRIAKQMGIDLSTVQGTGKGGMITEHDLRTASSEDVQVAEFTTKRISGVRKATADAMMKSVHNSAQFTLHAYADITDLARIRDDKLREMWISYNDLICYFTAKVIGDYPYMNAHVTEDGEIMEYKPVHLGVSIQTEDGLYSAVVRNADKLGLVEMSRAIDDLIDKAKTRTITMDELTGSTFTVSNLGMVDIEFFSPIINPPEVAILGVGTIRDHLARSGDGISFRKKIGLSLTIDHRAVDGYTAAQFLKGLKGVLEKPGSLP